MISCSGAPTIPGSLARQPFTCRRTAVSTATDTPRPESGPGGGGEAASVTAWLELVVPGGSGCRQQVGPDGVTLGRDRDQCDLVLAGRGISRCHAVIRPDGDQGFEIVDLDSAGGVHVNGIRIRGTSPLADGDLIGLGLPDSGQVRFHRREPGRFCRSLQLPPQPCWTIGRAAGCELALENVPTLSGRHLSLHNRGGRLLLRDEGSRNGTWVNGCRVRRAWLRDGDIVVAGFRQFRFRLLADGRLEVVQWDRSRSVRLECIGLGLHGGDRRNHPVLGNISLAIEPGEFVGILGPSGAGKTSLLQTMNGFLAPDEGRVLLNESPLHHGSAMFRHLLGYVPQDDILHTGLTVDQCLDYIARLRLPPAVDGEQRRQIIDSVLDLLDLAQVRHCRIDHLSGGQRKRVSVGGELITGPAILFLDEPTAGLDPGLEERLMAHFRHLAARGTTVLVTTHLLASLNMLDRIVILARGRLVFFGTPAEALQFFATPAGPLTGLSQIFDVLRGTGMDGENEDQEEKIARDFARRYRDSHYWQRNIGARLSPTARQLLAAGHRLQEQVPAMVRLRRRIVRPGLLRPETVFTLCRRQWTLLLGSRNRLLAGLCIPLLLSLVTMSQQIPGFAADKARSLQEQVMVRQIRQGGPVFEQRLKRIFTPAGAAESRDTVEILRALRFHNSANLPVPLSVLLMSVMSALFLGTMTGCLEIAPERMMYRRERQAGMAISGYLASKLATCLPLTAVQCLVFSAAWLLHPQLRQVALAPLWLTMTCIAWTSVAMGLAISALDPAGGRFSVLLAVGTVLPQLVLSGGIGPDYYGGMGAPLQRVADLLPARWGLAMTFTAVYPADVDGPRPDWVTGFIRERVGFDYGYDLWYTGAGMLAIQAVCWLFLCALLLKRRDPVP